MQQDNGPEHSSESTSKWLKGFGVGYTKPIFKLNLDFFGMTLNSHQWLN